MKEFFRRIPVATFIWSIGWTALVFMFNSARYQHHSLFYLFQHFDKFLHMLAGIAIATFAWGMITWIAPLSSVSQKFFVVITAALIVGGTWEILERFFALLDPHIMKFSLVDTTTDLLSDILGTCIAYVYFFSS